MKNKVLTRYLIISAISFLALAASFAMTIVFSIYNVGESNQFIQLLILIVAIISSILFVNASRAFINQRRFFKGLEMENSYTLGQASTFYNFEAFKQKAESLSRRRKFHDRRQFVIAFSGTALRISSSNFHNDMIASLNYNISLYLEDLFIRKNRLQVRDTVYGFNRGVFLICIFVENDRRIPELINIISNNIYRIVKEKNIKVYAQPFFGIKEVMEEENMTSAIEDAFIARSVSEGNFETYSYFNPSFKKEQNREDIIEIEEAIVNNEFIIYYQPKYSLKEKRFISSEAFARWNSPKHGLLSPAMFIDKAESAGLISLIDNYIFELALKNLSEQIKRGRRILPVSVNFSIYEFYSQGFIDHVVNLLEKYKVPASYVEIEITETTSQANQFISISIIKKLKELGIRVLMDDFGTGYSGIDNLRKIPFDAIKIDKSFTDLIVEDEKTRSIVKLLTDLGHQNDIEVIIEGVDNQKQVDYLKKIHIDTIQGYYYSRPISLEDYERFLKDNPFEKSEERGEDL